MGSKVNENKNIKIKLKIAKSNEIGNLKKLSTENLILWIVGRSEKEKLKLSIEEISLECWLINPEKHSLRGYPQYPDSFVVMKRIFDMKGRKGLLTGTVQGGFYLTDISKRKYADLISLMNKGKIPDIKIKDVTDRTISSMDEAPYRRLKKTPAYQKVSKNRTNELVETDFLYFYGISWHLRIPLIENKIKNVDLVVKNFSEKDPILAEVHRLLNFEYGYVRQKLLKKN